MRYSALRVYTVNGDKMVFLCEFSAPFAYLAVKKESYRKGAKNAKEPLDTVYGLACFPPVGCADVLVRRSSAYLGKPVNGLGNLAHILGDYVDKGEKFFTM